MKKSYHYATTALITAEGLIKNGGLPRVMGEQALVVAGSDQMVDEATPAFVSTRAARKDRVPVITQIDEKSAAILMLGDKFWAEMAMCHRWHFSETRAKLGWLEARGLAEAADFEQLLRIGAMLHTAQDVTGPHQGYVGWPCKENYARCVASKRKPKWWEVWARWIMKAEKDECWGHMLDPEIDDIERCREGALEAAWRLWEAITGEDRKQYYLEGLLQLEALDVVHCPQCITVVQIAKNNEELEQLANTAFQQLTGIPLREFRPFAPPTLEWDMWCQAVE